MNKRRKLLVALGATALGSPLTAYAQTKIWRIGFLSQRSRPVSLISEVYGAFLKALHELGYVEGKNLVIEWRFAGSKIDLFPEFAAEMVRLKVDVILTNSTPATGAAQNATTTIPVVMTTVGDPVGSGFVKTLARPGGNITGLSIVVPELAQKQLEMLISMVPKLSRAAVLINPDNSSDTTLLTNVQTAGQATKVTILPLAARTAQDIDKAFATMVRERAGGVIVSFDSLFYDQRRHISELALKHRLPSISGRKEYVEAGYLIGYGPDTADIYRRAATYVDKIFKGAKPADLPVEQPTKFEMFINGKTAKALGLKIPQSLLIMADKVIE